VNGELYEDYVYVPFPVYLLALRSNTILSEFYVHVTKHRNKFLYNKTNRCTDFPNLFWLKNEPLHVSGSSSAHHQEFIHRTLGTGICHTGLKAAFEQDHLGPARKLSSNLYDIYQRQVYSE
jgi:hypothetical protein